VVAEAGVCGWSGQSERCRSSCSTWEWRVWPEPAPRAP
jgi:hypothetical protein